MRGNDKRVVSLGGFIKKDCRIGDGVKIGTCCYIGSMCDISNIVTIRNDVHIDNNVSIASRCVIGYEVVIESNTQLGEYADVNHCTYIASHTTIGQYAYIGSRVSIGGVGKLNMSPEEGVTIGARSIIGLNSVIGHSVCIAEGVALVARSRVPNYERVTCNRSDTYAIGLLRYLYHNAVNGVRIRFGLKPVQFAR